MLKIADFAPFIAVCRSTARKRGLRANNGIVFPDLVFQIGTLEAALC